MFFLLFLLLGCYAPKLSLVESASTNSLELKPDKLAKLLLFDDEENEKICSGVMVAPDRAVTAWHCFDEFTFTVFGEVKGRQVALKHLVSHPDVREISESEVINDIAVVEFAQPLSPDWVASISTEGPRPGEAVTLFTFGGAGEGRGRLNLKHFIISSVSKHFFRAKGERSLCHGDSGGGVFRRTSSGFELIGLASSSTREECLADDEAIFVNLTSASARGFLEKWIKANPAPAAPDQ